VKIHKNSGSHGEEDWLEERYRLDAEARNKRVEHAVLEAFQRFPTLCVLDVGSGLGANARYYSRLFSSNQEWILVEKSKILSLRAISSLRFWAEANEWMTEELSEGLQIWLPEKEVRIKSINASFFHLSEIVDLSRINLVTANAVMDLISEDQFVTFAENLISYRIPLLATMNYESMYFEPEEEEDVEFIALYERHMKRSQEFGSALGPDSTRQIIDFSVKRGFPVIHGQSTWKIEYGDLKMMRFLFRFIHQALSENIRSKGERIRMEAWFRRKWQQVKSHKLKMVVEHSDIFAGLDEAKSLLR
jgi:hypothetical protein